MEIRVKVTPNRKKEIVTILPDGRFDVCVNADRKAGKANERMLKLIAEHFGVEEKEATLKSGHTSSTKTVIIKEKA